MGKLELRNGGFYLNGKSVPVEIGNREQIDLLKKVERKNDDLIGEGLEIDLECSKTWKENLNVFALIPFIWNLILIGYLT